MTELNEKIEKQSQVIYDKFNDLVTENGDVAGYIAFSIYIEEKINWIQHNIGNVSQEKIDSYETCKSVEDWERLKKQAESLLIGYSELYINNSWSSLKDRTISEAINNSLKTISFPKSVWASFVASFLWTLTLGIMAFIAATQSPKLTQFLINLLQGIQNP